MKYYLSLIIALLGLHLSSAQTTQNRPNVIFIYADDLGYGDLSSYGATQIQTPNIDRLAEKGVQFTNAHTTASTCTPSRYSVMTGSYAFRNNKAHILPGNAALLIPQNKTTLAGVFQKAGYKTGVVGKWHIGLGPKGGPDWNGSIKPGPLEVGFDYSFIFPATADRVPTIFVENHRVVGLDSEDPIAVNYQHKIGNDPTGKAHPELLKMKSSHGHNATIVNGIGRIGWMTGGKTARWTDEELSDTFLAKAKAFVARNQAQPFFLYYAVHQIHVPRMPATRFKGKSKMGYRGDVILEMDYAVGELMQTLEDLGIAKNTVVIFSSDNGPVLDDGYVDKAVELAHGHQPAGPFRGGKYSLYEGGTRVPFMVYWPNKIAPDTSNALISQVDLLASFAHYLNVDLAKDEALDSQNLWKTLLGHDQEGRQSYIEQNNGAALAYIEEGWKYIPPHQGPALNKAVNIETGLSMQPQLYNLTTDKAEQHNLAKQFPKRVKRMAKQLKKKVEAGRTR